MRHFLLYILFFLSGSLLPAQTVFNPVKLDVGLAVGELTKHHAGFATPYLELKVNLNNHFTSGARIEYVYFSQRDQSLLLNPANNASYWNGLESDGSLSSLLFTTDYTFTTRKTRPFVGGGAGLYFASLSEQNVFINTDENLTIFGAMARIGFNIEHFRFAMEYNFLPNSVINLNYISVKVGFEIGGGRKLFVKP